MSYFIWLILGVIAFVLEMMMPTFFALFAGIGFISAAVVAYLQPESLFSQLIVASVFMIIGVIVFKRKGLAETETSEVGTHNEFIGIEGIITVSPSAHTEGEVELLEPIVGSRSWPAVCLSGTLDVGTEIKITQLRGNTLVVEKK